MTSPLSVEVMSGIIDVVADHARASGKFDRVNGHEPKNAPGRGLSAAVWVDRLLPYAGRSGLAATSVVLVLSVRIYTNAFDSVNLDMIDPNLLDASTHLFAAYSADFTLSGSVVANVDLLGASGVPLAGRAGYQNLDGKIYRVWTIDLPLVIDNAFDQAP